MPTLEELRQRYRSYSDVELADLAQAVELTPEAQVALSEEVAARSLSLADLSAAPSATAAPSWSPRGWITVFQALVAILVGVYAIWTFRKFMTIEAPLGRILPYLVAGEALAAIPITGLVLIARRSRFARPFWLYYLGITGATATLLPLFVGSYTWDFVPRISLITAWFLYWKRSTRVRDEFPAATG